MSGSEKRELRACSLFTPPMSVASCLLIRSRVDLNNSADTNNRIPAVWSDSPTYERPYGVTGNNT